MLAKGIEINSATDPALKDWFLSNTNGFLFERADVDMFNRWSLELHGEDVDGGRVLGYKELYSECLQEKKSGTPIKIIMASTVTALLIGLAAGIVVKDQVN